MTLLDRPLTVVDVETWMPDYGGRHQLVEIAAVVVDVEGKIARGHLRRDGTSAGRGNPLVYHSLCRPADFPRRCYLRNAVNPAWLWKSGVRSEAVVARDFAEWCFGVALDSPLVAYNAGFDRSALHGALRLTSKEDELIWGKCLMAEACEALMLKTDGGKIRRKAPKSEVAAELFDVRTTMTLLAKMIGWTGPLTMHLGLPDALLEVAILVAVRKLTANRAATDAGLEAMRSAGLDSSP